MKLTPRPDVKRGSLHFNSLRAFEAAARHLSFSRAADELHVTHSAISHQVRQLETSLGFDLFHRSNRGVTLTEAGQTLMPVLADAFDRIATTLSGLVADQHEGALKVTTTPTFAAKWLIPRLGDWQRRYPAIPIHLHPTLAFSNLGSDEADIGLRCGLAPWQGLESELMLPIHLTPLCSRAACTVLGDNPDPAVMLEQTLIHADVRGHALGEEWRYWLEAARVPAGEELPGLSFQDPNLALQAAMDGVGFAMGYLELAQPDIDAGRLVQPFDLTAVHPFSYFLVWPKTRSGDSRVTAFRDWIGEQI
jgi:LysR family transcriptional regulator, glycine cleavage system transcriptional activator